MSFSCETREVPKSPLLSEIGPFQETVYKPRIITENLEEERIKDKIRWFANVSQVPSGWQKKYIPSFSQG